MVKASETFVSGFSANPDYDFEIRCVLGLAYAGASDTGEVLAAVSGIGKNEHEKWFAAWDALGDRIAAIGDASSDASHDESAASAYLRASAYYGVAVNAVSALDSTDQLLPTFTKQRRAWERFIGTTSVDARSVEIPYEGTTLPGYYFRSTAPGDTHPVLVAVNGSDGSLAALWSSAVSGALARGYDALVFDGPGQQSMLFERNTTFRPDWEAVLTPVLDFVLGHAGVDADRVAVYGISQAGYWVPRALAFEHRFAAAIVDPGVVDVSTSWTTHLPNGLLKLLDEKENTKFDREMALGLKLSPGTARTWNFRARPYGSGGYAETIEAVRAYTVVDEATAITTPLLITEPEDEQFWPGQSQELAALTPSVSTVVKFTAAEGANYHCQPLARALTEQRMFDWLDAILNRA
ncbi:dipeptidyl aminopeptidase [Herbiconiux sp. CPCC 205763]|uniref:Dipeptidyl aminopeptidase n=1 Tax=Herbiconiux aconitum TaxID=2970913 RepID=A0ABT2GPY2_9MICO|nr:dipeptidyl aminopeptidase [Herbiconiux aconitum]MCS5718285.1 dipeptidyl aminopeptidase [Herbiconiux aconitum]